jgi:hypothetical protein
MATPAPASTGTWTPPPGRLGNLTLTQEAALAKFGAELRAEGAWVEARHDDATLLRSSLCPRFSCVVLTGHRFLRARKFDVPKAKEMILACEKWRKEFGVDELVRWVALTLHSFVIFSCWVQVIQVYGAERGGQVLSTVLSCMSCLSFCPRPR